MQKKVELSRTFRENEPPVDELRAGESRQLLARAAARKEIKYHPGVFKIALLQFGYAEKKHWAYQGIIFVLMSALLYKTGLLERKYVDIITAGSVMTSLLGLIGILALGRLFSHHMGEIEAVCYFNLGQLAGMRMLLYGIIDIIVVGILSGIVSGKTAFGWFPSSIYLLVPFVISNIVYLMVFSVVRGRAQGFVFTVTGIFLALIFAMAGAYPWLYEKAQFAGWIIVFIFAMGIFFAEISCFMKKIEKGEVVCLN